VNGLQICELRYWLSYWHGNGLEMKGRFLTAATFLRDASAPFSLRCSFDLECERLSDSL